MQEFQWVLQSNLTNLKTLNEVRAALIADNVAFEEVKIIPFSDALPEISNRSLFSIFYGSTTLMLNAYNDQHFRGGVFYNESFTISNYLEKWGNKMLNEDALIMTLEEFAGKNLNPQSEWFIRPNEDNKAFSGMTLYFEQFMNFFEIVKNSSNPHLNSQKDIAVSTPKTITTEWRSFIVNGKIISTSRYLHEGKFLTSSNAVPPSLIDFIEKVIRQYSPHDIFAIDIALSGEEYRIIECNCFNGTGFYDHNIPAIIRAVNNYLRQLSIPNKFYGESGQAQEM
jgi:hypothetical protein